MSQWVAPSVTGDMDTKQLADLVSMLVGDLDFVINGNVDWKNIRAGSITADRLVVGSITADYLKVTELSAITANMGTITAGSITTSATINVGTDARIGDILYLKETDSSGQKGIVFDTNSGTSAEISVLTGDMSINTDGFITLSIGSSQGLVVNQQVTAPVFDATSGMSVNGVSVVLSGTNTTNAGSHDHGIPDGTELMVNGGGTVTFYSEGSHDHTVV